VNRNALKIIALISMLIDHIGLHLLGDNIVCRIIGRLAFPIFAFFVAEGLKKTRNQKRYILLLLLFAIISQMPYSLLSVWWHLNILCTFLISIGVIKLIEWYISSYKKRAIADQVFSLVFVILTIVLISFLGHIGVVDYGILGVLLVVVFYFFKKPYNYIFGALVLFLLGVDRIVRSGISVKTLLWAFSTLLSIILLFAYNNNKGKMNLKYLFYIFYPLHLFVIWILILVAL
jgi:hypothetical protein